MKEGSEIKTGATITIATSIMPRRIEAQQVAVTSWQQLGFDVISVNSGNEVDHLHQAFPGVQFKIVENINTNLLNVPLHNIFTCLLKSNSTICGIVNSDVCLVPRADLSKYIYEHAPQAVVFGSRIDVSLCDQSAEVENALGFDFFFFDRDILARFPVGDFQLGMPWWDYWFPLVIASMGFKLKRLMTPVAYHVVHDVAWSDEDLDNYWRLMVEGLSVLAGSENGELLSAPQFSYAVKSEMIRGAEMLRNHLQYATASLFIPYTEDCYNTVTFNESAFLDMKAKLIDYEKRLTEYQQLLTGVYASSSWQLTKPLRRLKAAVKRLVR